MGEYYRKTFLLSEDENSSTKIVILIILAFILISIIILTTVFITNTVENRIMSGVYIDNVNVSGLNKEEAHMLVENKIKKEMPTNLNLAHNEYTTVLDINQIHAMYDIDSAVEKACSIGKSNDYWTNIKDVFGIILFHKNINLNFTYSDEELEVFLEDMSEKLPDTIVQSSYYIEDDKIILTKGKAGYVIDIENTINKVMNVIKDRNYNDKIVEVETNLIEPEKIDIEKIHSEIYKEAVNAYYTTDPYVIHPHENGVDFNISVDEAKELVNGDEEEYTIKLKYSTPEITTNMIGTEAFPNLLSSFTTKYNTSQKDRTTNLVLAASKINGTVVMPGETFSYNTVVGKRTIEAGYKNAAIYENGQVVDGLGGGICQISTTLYNAVLYANLEIVSRRNHQFVPSYVSAGRDATVVYGTTDFKFKNNRNYPIKIVCSVERGIAKFEIYGLREETEYEVEISSKIVSSTSTSLKSETYKKLKLNGEVVSSEIISKDTYKKH